MSILCCKAKLICAFLLLICFNVALGDDGYELWLNYNRPLDASICSDYGNYLNNSRIIGDSKTMEIIKDELTKASKGLCNFQFNQNLSNNQLVIGNYEQLPSELKNLISNRLPNNPEAFIIIQKSTGNKEIVITSNSDIGVLYGTFEFIKQLQLGNSLDGLEIVSSPKIDLRLLNHWDNLDRTVERGYSGFSIWNWHTLPDYIDQRYIDYARANASIGINGTVLTNVNSNALILTEPYLQKVKALADLFRPYGIKVYLTARFSAPIEIGGLETADPLNQKVVAWWKDKANEIYSEIPDFGGFLVKANSEGQPGPQNYGRNHVDGANMLARAVKPHKGVVMWRAFVYSEHNDEDRAKQAYSEFVPYDGKFDDNVIIQVKNGAIDFQPREPFHPMFGAMPNTPLMMEFQITQEYLGQGTHLVYLPALFEEVLEEDTYVKGKGSTVAKVIDGELFNYEMTGMAGVSNIGTDRNWTGHHFLQANWYGYGRLSWNHELKAEDIAREWIALTLTRNSKAIDSITEIMMESREAVVNYMDPLGLHHIFATSHHYGPGPWVDNLGRPDWNPVYYHQADSEGVGFDRTKTGSNALEQYSPAIQKEYGNIKTIPEKYLLWFHHVPWDYNLNNGKTLWDNLALKYQEGVNQVIDMKNSWSGLRKDIDPTIHKEVSMMLDIQLAEARWWKDACLSYFNSFAMKKYPLGVEPPKHSLEYYKTLKFPYAPGIRPQW